MKGLIILLAGVMSMLAAPARAQWSVDLAQVGDKQFQVAPGEEARVTVINMRPKGNYRISALMRVIPVPLLPDIAGLTFESAGSCAPLLTEAGELDNAATEAEVPGRIASLNAQLPTAKCSDSQKAAILAVLAKTTYPLPRRYVIRAGEELIVTVQRLTGEAVEQQWTLTLTTGEPGSWRTMYGLSFFRDRDDKPFLAPGENDGEFVVNPGLSKDAEGKPLKAAPSVFFTWMARRAELGPLSFSPTLGIGATSAVPGLFGGIAVTFRQNLALVAGIPVTIQERVKQQYLNEPIVKSALTTEQLTNRRYYADKFFIGGVFRFSSNPFGEAKKPAQEKPEESKPGAKLEEGKPAEGAKPEPAKPKSPPPEEQ